MLAATPSSLGVVAVSLPAQMRPAIAPVPFGWHLRLSILGAAVIVSCIFSGLVDHLMGLTLPDNSITFAALIAFLSVVFWARHVGRADSGGAGKATALCPALLTVVSSLAPTRPGHAPMPASVGDRDWSDAWRDTARGAVLAVAAAITAASVRHDRLSERSVRNAAGVLFLLVGLWMLIIGALGWRPVTAAVTVLVVLAAAGSAAFGPARERAPTPWSAG